MSIKIRWSRAHDFAVVLMILTVIAGISHYVITNPLGPSRILFKIQTPLIVSSTNCSAGAPEWMIEMAGNGVRTMGAVASQLAYISPQGEAHHCESGWKDGVLGDTALQKDHRFRYASVSKTITAIVVIDLVNRGKISLDDKVVDLLGITGPFKDTRVADISVEHLLTHRAGWDRVRGQDAMFMRGVEPWCPTHPENLAGSHLMYDPGDKMAYSNLGYCLLGLVIQELSGLSYRAYTEDNFRFSESTLGFVDGPFADDEVAYDFRHEEFFTDDYINFYHFEEISSSAGLSGNAVDLARIVKKSINNSEPLSVLQVPDLSACDIDSLRGCYGFGLYHFQPDSTSLRISYHGGKFPGAVSALIIDERGGVTVWLGAGTPPAASGGSEEFYLQTQRLLSQYYRSL